MSDPCDWVKENAPALVRGLEPPADVALHMADCMGCRAVTEGASALKEDLDGWVTPEPPSDLLERTLARMATASQQDDRDAEVPETPTRAPRHRRRTSVEILTGTAVVGNVITPPVKRRLLWRLLGQAAAAALLFAVCTSFVAVFYPAVTLAFEDRQIRRCQVQLSRLAKGARLYHREHPESEALQGGALRRALVAGGYCDALDFVCPSKSGTELRERSYSGRIPAGSEPLPLGEPLFLDRFSNHSSGFNVAFGTGHVEAITVDAFPAWVSSRRPRAAD